MSCNKWTTSSVKANLYNKYRAEWLQTHDFDFVRIYKKFNEYLQKNNLEASNESFELFQDECCDASMWMQFWDWESEILTSEIQNGIFFLIDENYSLSIVCSTVYLCGSRGDCNDVDIRIEIEDAYKKSLAEIIFDIAEAVVTYEYKPDDEVEIFLRHPASKNKVSDMIDWIINDAYSASQY